MFANVKYLYYQYVSNWVITMLPLTHWLPLHSICTLVPAHFSNSMLLYTDTILEKVATQQNQILPGKRKIDSMQLMVSCLPFLLMVSCLPFLVFLGLFKINAQSAYESATPSF